MRAALLAPLAFPAVAAEPGRTDFLREAMSAGMGQMLYGRIAVQRAADGQVVALAEEVLRENAAANARLLALAQAAGLPPRPVSAYGAERDLEALMRTPAHSFDLAWLAVLAREQRRLAALYGRYAAEGEDPALRAHAAAVLPSIQARLEAAEALAERTETAETR